MKKKDEKNKIKPTETVEDDAKIIATAVAGTETVTRYGNANAEYIIGYQGRDNITGKEFQKSLKKISSYNINPDYRDNNLRQ